MAHNIRSLMHNRLFYTFGLKLNNIGVNVMLQPQQHQLPDPLPPLSQRCSCFFSKSST